MDILRLRKYILCDSASHIRTNAQIIISLTVLSRLRLYIGSAKIQNVRK